MAKFLDKFQHWEIDAALVRKYRSGDDKAFDALYKKYEKHVSELAYNKTIVEHIREDLAQEIWCKIYLNMHRYDPAKGSFFTWMMAVAHNACCDYLRSVQGKWTMLLYCSSSADDGDHTEELNLERSMDGKYIYSKMFSLLPPEYRTVLALSLEGVPHEEIALIQKIPLGTVKTRIYISKRNFKTTFLRTAS
jgi:RNA polymerase sigma-70 factor, ECF subfamily